MSAEPTMANNAEDIENNMVSMKECVIVATTLFPPALMYWVMIGKVFCTTQCCSVAAW